MPSFAGILTSANVDDLVAFLETRLRVDGSWQAENAPVLRER
jgi:hypothetical protein